jgi:hypothetical protein
MVTAKQDFPLWGNLLFNITNKNGVYCIQHDEEDFFPPPNPDSATIYLFGLINYYVRAKLPKLLTVHSGCATLNNKRFILVGDKGVGKTTLLCKLLFSGEMVHSDEYVILDDCQIIPFPRKFLIKEGTLKFVPELSNICKNLKSYPSFLGGFYFFLIQ